MKIIAFFTMLTAVSLFTISGGVYAKQNNDAGQDFNKGSESSEFNTNRQTQTQENVRGTDRAGERHELKSTTTTTRSHKKTRTKKTHTPHQK